jgi:glycine betaine/proline transport system ATP-binding protein
MTTKIRVENLIKIFGPAPRRRALPMLRNGASKDEILKRTGHVVGVDRVSFSVEEGEIFVVMGLSGSGKSTLIRCLNRLHEPTDGHIYLDGDDVVAADKLRLQEIRRTKMAMVFQHFGLLPHRTVLENVAYGLRVRGAPEAEQRQKAQEALRLVGLEDWGSHYPHNLSGGMQQRVGLARALATDADVLLMDEAFSALDPLIRRQMQDELMQLQARLKKTIVFITHDLNEALRVGNHVAVMRDGAIVQIGTPTEIVTEPANEYVARFMADVDQSRVLSAEFVMKPAPTVTQDATVREALAVMDRTQSDTVFVVDSRGNADGVLHRGDLENLSTNGTGPIRSAIRGNFPTAARFSTLKEMWGLSKDGEPIAIVNDNGQLLGAVNPLDILSTLAAAERAAEGVAGNHSRGIHNGAQTEPAAVERAPAEP